MWSLEEAAFAAVFPPDVISVLPPDVISLVVAVPLCIESTAAIWSELFIVPKCEQVMLSDDWASAGKLDAASTATAARMVFIFAFLSKSANGVRAVGIEAITRHQSEYLWKRMSALGWRTREPQETDFPYEEPTVFPKLLKMHSDDMAYDWATLQKLLHTDISDLQRFYGSYLGRGKPGLYVVK